MGRHTYVCMYGQMFDWIYVRLYFLGSKITADITLPLYFLFCKYLLIYLAVPGLSYGVGSFIFCVACGILQLRHAGFFFFFLSCGMRDLVPWPGSSESYPLGPPGKSLPLIPSYLETAVVFWLSLPLLQPAPFDSFFKILLEWSSKKYIHGHATPYQRFSSISPFLIISLPFLSLSS